ncbi:MAG: carbohydrate porin, partial [Deltaproteobacteria bacterium]
TWGALVDVNYARWAVRAAVAMVPAVANGLAMDDKLREAGSLTVEADYRYGLGRWGNGTLRALVYDNRAHMGVYADAVRDVRGSVGLQPDVQRTRGYRSKWGGAVSFEHNLRGNNGIFLKLGWADGRYESWAFTEIERSLAVGGQIDGALWQRRDDRIGVALLLNGIAKEHMRYLGAGGIGFIIGDGGLHYGPEGVIEGYYAWQVTSWMALTADIQGILNPGYNRDRGPLAVGAIRLHLAY